jgi:RNA polymerase sigma factor (TIGR02999 family)
VSASQTDPGESAASDVSVVLGRAARGDPAAVRDLLPLVYDDLRRRARVYLAGQRAGHTLQPTALVHEAFAELAQANVAWEGSRHFFNAAAQAMRQILVDHARSRGARKRGGGMGRLDLDKVTMAGPAGSDDDEIDWEALDVAMADLQRQDPRRHQVVMYRYFAGLSEEKTAELMEISEKTVQRDWKVARLFLLARLGGSGGAAANDQRRT